MQHNKFLLSLSLSLCDQDSMLVSCGYDMDVNIWNMNTYQLRNCFKVSFHSKTHISLSLVPTHCSGEEPGYEAT